LWVDSAAAAHNISETQNHADHRTHKRIKFSASRLESFDPTKVSCFGIGLFELITVIQRNATAVKLL